ncbi:hypothetical protein CRG98_042468 [Punica granatum]|uniref:Pentatricopeptide repeat-containing protein At3g25970 n=1 Tax=Punica granatum TaxID=22663 RepID=A0A2I0HZX0_PUNGR|nr:hypothetical protein CRG98_042468 [Punica granatum]
MMRDLRPERKTMRELSSERKLRPLEPMRVRRELRPTLQENKPAEERKHILSLPGAVSPPHATSSVSALSKVLSTHGHSIKLGTISDVYAANIILNGYTRCRELPIAHKVFDEMPHRDTVSWNTLIAGHVNCGKFESAWEVLIDMRRGGMGIDGYTFGSVLKGVACAVRLDLGEQLHSMILKMGLLENVYCGSALLDMYAKSERVWDAFLVLQHMPEPNSVSWNALISGFSKNKDREMAFWLLGCMESECVKPDDGTFAPLLTLLDGPNFYKQTVQIHAKTVKHGLESKNTVCNAMITSYSECGSIGDAKKVFDGSFLTQDIVTWNSMLAAYLVHSEEDSAFKLFILMQQKSLGICLHGLVIKRGLEISVPISNALIAVYLKSNNRSMEEALRIFESIESKDRVSWNTILTGYSQFGLSEDTLNLFALMRYLLVEIDHYSFSAVLKSCSDLATLQLGQEVHALALKTGFESNEFVAGSLIFMTCGDIELASTVASQLLELEPEEHCTYILLSDMYGNLGKWGEKAEIKRLMRERGVRKVPGWSWIEVQNEVHAFNAEDHSHPHCTDIYFMLGGLMEEIRRLDLVLDANLEALGENFDSCLDCLV